MDQNIENTALKIFHLRKVIQQTRRELLNNRSPVSLTSQELINFCEAHKRADVLVVGFKTQKQNPFRETSGCSFL